MKITIDLPDIEGKDAIMTMRKHTNLECEDCQVGFEILKNGVKVKEEIVERREDGHSIGYRAYSKIKEAFESSFREVTYDQLCEFLGVEIPEEKETPQEEISEMAEV